MVLGEVIFSHIIHHLNPIHLHSPALETHYDNGLCVGEQGNFKFPLHNYLLLLDFLLVKATSQCW